MVGPRDEVAWLARPVAAVIATTTAVLAVLALRRDPDVMASHWLIAADLGVGLMFPLAGLLARGEVAHRLAFSSVGPAWLAGSVSGLFVEFHQAALLVALAAFPRMQWWLISLAVTMGVGVTVTAPGALATGLVFAAFAVVFLVVDFRSVLHERGFPVLAAVCLMGVLLHAHWLAMNSRVAEPLLYAGALSACAAGYVPASLAVVRRRRGFGSRALTGATGMDGLARLLRSAVRDPGLEITSDGKVLSDCVALTDPEVAGSVAEVVQLVMRHENLRLADAARIDALESARARLVSAVDDERARAGDELEQRVGVVLDTAVAELLERVPVVSSALGAARDEMHRLVAGLPPVDLGRVGLRRALQRLASLAPIAVELDIGESATPEVEAALFFVSCEALTNAIKHSGASRLRLRLHMTGNGIVYVASDDGRGGADLRGSGLTGLVDRVDAVGGTLEVVSPQGHGTTMTVRVSSDACRRNVGDVGADVISQD